MKDKTLKNNLEEKDNASIREEMESVIKYIQGRKKKKLGPEEDFTKKVSHIQSLFKERKAKKANKEIDFKGDFNQEIDLFIMGMPSELIELVNEEIEFCLENDCGPKVLRKRVLDKMNLLSLAYKDSRRYLDIYGRNYQELLLSDFITEISESDYSEDDWYRVARVNFNLDCLMLVNEAGIEEHSSGNRLLEIFTNTLERGETAKALEEWGIRVVTAADGAEKFSWLLYAPFDLRPMLTTIERLFLEEIKNQEVDFLVDLQGSNRVRKAFELMGVNAPDDASFRINVSMGSATLGEVLESLKIPEDVSYEEMGRILMNNMFRTADERASQHRREITKLLKEYNKGMYALHSISDIKILEERIKELKEENEKLRAESSKK